jgi:hypothetical protein
MKKIVFAHNVYNRFKTLDHTIRVEKLLFPNSYSIVGYNAESPEEVLSKYNNIEILKFQGETHKIGCTNGCIATIKAALKHNPDVIVFSHDDVSLETTKESIQNFSKNIELISNGKYDAICRKPLPTTSFGKEYYLMEVFYISKNAAEIAFGNLPFYSDERLISRDVRGSISPEVFLYETLNNKNLNVLEKSYIHELNNYNKTLSELMGFSHKNAGDRGWND